MSKTEPKSWRDVIKVHPAADLFPMMSPDELKVLGDDIKANGLTHQIVLWSPDCGHEKWSKLDCIRKLKRGECYLLDGRNRVAAGGSLDGIGLDDDVWPNIVLPPALDAYDAIVLGPETDPWHYVLSANIHRRHLTAEQKREIIAKLLKAQPEKSNRTIAQQTKADDKTVAAVRGKLEATAEIPQLTKTVGADGKVRTTAPTRKARRTADDFIADRKAQAMAVADRAERQMQISAQSVSIPKQSDLEHVLPDADRLVLEILERDKAAPGYAKAVMAGIAARLEVSGYPDIPDTLRREPTIAPDART